MSEPNSSLEELHRIKIMQELQKEIADWAKRRFTVFSVFVTVLGFFGLSTVVNQTVQNFVNSPVQKQLDKIDHARDEANTTIMRLQFLSTDVSNKGQQAVEAAKDASDKAKVLGERISRLDSLVTESEQTAKDIIQKYDDVRTSLTAVSLKAFDELQKGKLSDQVIAARVDRVKDSQQAIMDFVRYVSGNAGDAGMRQHALDLYNEISRVEERYNRIIAEVQRRNATNVVIYVPKGSAMEESAEKLELALRNAGYFSSVWYPSGKNKAEYEADTIADFNNSIERNVLDNLVVLIPDSSKSGSFYKSDIASIAQLANLSLKVVNQKIEPQEKHLRKAGNERFAKDDVILIALLGD